MSNSNRQRAVRVLATELNAAHTRHEREEDADNDRAPKFLVLPSGAGANRVLMTGVVTGIQDVGSDDEYLRMECTDVSGESFFSYAGQYSPGAAAKMKELESPAFVTVIGKPSTYENDDGDVLVSIDPEVIQEIDRSDYMRLLTKVADATVDRIANGTGSDLFQGMADTLHTADEREAIYDNAVEVLESVLTDRAEAEAIEEDEEEMLTEDELASLDYDELRNIAKQFDDVSGNASAADIRAGLEGKPAPA